MTVSTWSLGTLPGLASVSSPPVLSSERWGRPHVLPSKLGRALTRQYDGAVACMTNSSVVLCSTRRERMSTSGLGTSVTPPPPRLLVSTHGSSSAPGRRGPIAQAPSTTITAATPTAGNVATSGLRVGPSVVRGVRAKRARSIATATRPVATSSRDSRTRPRSVPRAATNTNRTAPGTSASPRPWAWNANVSPSSTTNATPTSPSIAQPPS